MKTVSRLLVFSGNFITLGGILQLVGSIQWIPFVGGINWIIFGVIFMILGVIIIDAE